MTDLKAEQKEIRKQSGLAFLLCAAISVACVLFLPKLVTFPSVIGARLAFAIQTSFVHFALVLLAVRLVSSGRYRSAADIGGAAKGGGDYTKVTYLHGKGERIANVTRQVGS
ncbi:hypothetical protein [Sphingomonas sp.]|uniref:hypothetical protein n=2 Tax=Sphingomonadales TaxID=204457 RepID=UPI00185382C2|nr:hypothetical protein [Sphingomonas sp.]MBA4762971.1 hypothetical protein [Sphingomonas sp.]